MEKNLSLNETARSRMLNKIDSTGKILEIGALCNPLFKKDEFDVYYADIYGTEEIKVRFSYFNQELIERMVPVDYVLDESYSKTFNGTGMKFDYIVSSHVLEHMPNPIEFLFDVLSILNVHGKICLLLPDKEFTFDHYRENTSFADWFDVYSRGEANNVPRIVFDSEFCKVNENDFVKYWNKTVSPCPNPEINHVLDLYDDLVENCENNTFDGHYWVFTDRSFLRILVNLIRLNILPYKLIDFFPTAINDNTFGLILELDYTVKDDSAFRQHQINEINEISKNIEEKRFEINAQHIIQENIKLKEILNNIIYILKDKYIE